jgi:peptide-methionine (R)-S-oxide reductase
MMKVIKTKEEWQQQLTPEEFYVCREAGTEKPFSGKYNNFKEDGIFTCKCCGSALFDSKAKFDSKTGWPSFYEPINDSALTEHKDMSHAMIRIEVRCATCDAHLGHVFEDGPAPTGLRYCINSICLNFTPRGA